MPQSNELCRLKTQRGVRAREMDKEMDEESDSPTRS